MRPRRYPYSGKIKKPIEQAIDKDAILQWASLISQSKHPVSGLKIDKHMAF